MWRQWTCSCGSTSNQNTWHSHLRELSQPWSYPQGDPSSVRWAPVKDSFCDTEVRLAVQELLEGLQQLSSSTSPGICFKGGQDWEERLGQVSYSKPVLKSSPFWIYVNRFNLRWASAPWPTDCHSTLPHAPSLSAILIMSRITVTWPAITSFPGCESVVIWIHLLNLH